MRDNDTAEACPSGHMHTDMGAAITFLTLKKKSDLFQVGQLLRVLTSGLSSWVGDLAGLLEGAIEAVGVPDFKSWISRLVDLKDSRAKRCSRLTRVSVGVVMARRQTWKLRLGSCCLL